MHPTSHKLTAVSPPSPKNHYRSQFNSYCTCNTPASADTDRSSEDVKSRRREGEGKGKETERTGGNCAPSVLLCLDMLRCENPNAFIPALLFCLNFKISDDENVKKNEMKFKTEN